MTTSYSSIACLLIGLARLWPREHFQVMDGGKASLDVLYVMTFSKHGNESLQSITMGRICCTAHKSLKFVLIEEFL